MKKQNKNQNQNLIQNQNQNQNQNQKEEIIVKTPEEIVVKIIETNRKMKGIQTLVPCLYGESGTGKTTRAYKIAEQLGLKLKIILLHSMLPEEVLGLPRVEDGKTIWALPEWYSEEPTLYFFDELDKVREEELGTILTLLADKKVRDHYLHPDSVIMVGMQPIDPSYWTSTKTGQALIARLIFIPTSSKDAISYLSAKYNINLDFIKYDENITLPLMMPTPRQIEYGLNCINIIGIMNRQDWIPILQGIFPPEFLKVFISEIERTNFLLDPELLCRTLNEDPSLVDKLSITDLQKLSGPIMRYCNPEIIAKAEGRILLECTPEGWLSYHNNRFEYLYNEAMQSPDKTIDVGNNCTIEEMYKAFEKVLPNVIDELNRRKEGK